MAKKARRIEPQPPRPSGPYVAPPEAVVMLTDSREGRRGAVVMGLTHFRLEALVTAKMARWAGPADLARRKAGQLVEV